MISINRPVLPPEPLASAMSAARDAICSAYDAGARLFPFEENLYGAATVRRSLAEMQHKKCAYCETYIGNDGTIDHFRPKAASQQRRGGKFTRPGYYWLAYEWTNLLLACGPCNSAHKRNLFPLENPRSRARHHKVDLAREKPLLIDPSQDNPELYLEFRDEFIRPVNDNVRGEATIDTLRLNRETLTETRRNRLRFLRDLADTRQMLLQELAGVPSAVAEAEKLRLKLEAYCVQSQPFTAMTRAAAARNYRSYSESE